MSVKEKRIIKRKTTKKTAHYATNTSHDTLQERLRVYFMQSPIIDVRTVCGTVTFLFKLVQASSSAPLINDKSHKGRLFGQ